MAYGNSRRNGEGSRGGALRSAEGRKKERERGNEMKKNVQILTVQDVGDSFDVELNWGHIRTIKSLTYILYVVLRSAIRAAQSEGASDDEVLRMISVATLLAARDAGITGEIEAFVASKKAKEECEA